MEVGTASAGPAQARLRLLRATLDWLNGLQLRRQTLVVSPQLTTTIARRQRVVIVLFAVDILELLLTLDASVQ